MTVAVDPHRQKADYETRPKVCGVVDSLPPVAPLPDTVKELHVAAEKHFRDFRITTAELGGTIDIYATCRRCDDGVGCSGDTVWEALCYMLASAEHCRSHQG